jgi:hypothetical protein
MPHKRKHTRKYRSRKGGWLLLTIMVLNSVWLLNGVEMAWSDFIPDERTRKMEHDKQNSSQEACENKCNSDFVACVESMRTDCLVRFRDCDSACKI